MHDALATLQYGHRIRRSSALTVLGLLALLFGFNLLVPVLFNTHYNYVSFSNSGLYTLFMVIFMNTFAHSDTTFLCSRPLTRRGIWLGAIGFIVAYGALFTVFNIALSLLSYGVCSWLSTIAPTRYTMAGSMAWGAFAPANTLTLARDSFMNYVAFGLLAYAYGCLLRRWRGWTIALTILIPVLMIAVFIMPTVYLFINDMEALVETQDITQMLQTLPSWLSLIQRIVLWFQEYYNVIAWSIVAACLPVSFFVMRTTRQS